VVSDSVRGLSGRISLGAAEGRLGVAAIRV